MKVGLISPYSLISNHAIRSLSAVLKADGHSVVMLHLPKDNGRELLGENAFIEPYAPEVIDSVISLVKDCGIVGVTLMSQFLALAVDLTDDIRRRTGAMVIWGGIHPTIDPEASLKYADAVCIGEGEEALLELVRLKEKGKDFYGMRNFWFRKDGDVIRNPLRSYIGDLDALPFQDYGLKDHYVLWDRKVRPLTKEIVGSTYNTYMTKGCPRSCAFCCNEVVNGLYKGQSRMRKRSVDSVISEIKSIKESPDFLKLERVKLVDDLFPALPIEELAEFGARYKKEISLPLSVCGWTPETVREDKIRVLVDAGMDVTRMGIQHGSPRIRKLFRRGGTNDKIIECARTFNRFRGRLSMTYDIITDNPYEKAEDTAESLRLFSILPRPYHISMFSLLPFPGTSVYKWAVRDGYLSGDWLEDLKNGRFNGRSLSREYKFTFEDNYYNNMYLIFQAYYLPLWLKRFLINPSLVRLKITYPAYYLLKSSLGFVRYAGMVKNRKDLTGLLKRGFDALRQGDFNRIKNSILRPKRTW